MRKLWIFIQSDGLANTLKFVWKGIAGKCYHLSRTLCLYVEKENVAINRRSIWNVYRCRIITEVKELSSINFGRLKLLPCRRWLENGSMVVVVFKDDVPVAFGWTHFKNHAIDYVGDFDMGTKIAWMGPIFVHRKHRGKGLQQWVIRQVVNNVPANIKAFITSVNAGNKASLRSLEKCGFKVGMEICCETGFFATRGTEVKVLDKRSNGYLRIRE